jgi:hypothetical protein
MRLPHLWQLVFFLLLRLFSTTPYLEIESIKKKDKTDSDFYLYKKTGKDMIICLKFNSNLFFFL